jgi:hypothetical protein
MDRRLLRLLAAPGGPRGLGVGGDHLVRSGQGDQRRQGKRRGAHENHFHTITRSP